MSYPTQLVLPHGMLHFPMFLPDATRGVVRAVISQDLEQIGTQALLMNTFHLMLRPGSSTIQALGGLHTMSGWSKPILTDSGGFQAYSLVREQPKQGSLTDKGISIRRQGSKRKYHLTPEKSIQLQMAFGADVLFCLDDCTHIRDSETVQREAMERTVAWAKRCRSEFDKLIMEKQIASEARPKLFAVVQGGGDLSLRKECAQQLLTIGFDGFGYGGWPLDDQGVLLEELLGYTRELIPEPFPLHALGVGRPDYVAACASLGYQMFDSALPTRDARRGRLYIFNNTSGLDGDWYSTLYIHDKKHIRSAEPLSSFCDCPTCRRYSLGYLHHLFKLNDHSYYRLATLHNLSFMRQLDNRLRDRYG